MASDNSTRTAWIGVLIIAAIAGLVWFWASQGAGDSNASQVIEPTPAAPIIAPPVEPPAPVESPPVVSAAEAQDAKLREQFVGFWHHAESGDHWIENRADGTSRMLLKLDFVASLLYGKETAMELAWEVKGGVLTHTITSGSPQANVDSLIKAFGKTRGYTILESTPERMLLESKNEKKKKDLWARSAAPPEWVEKALDAGN